MKALLLSKIDREDYWVCGGMVFPTEGIFYEEIYHELKSRLESAEVVEKIQTHFDDCGDFITTHYQNAVVYEFSNRDIRFQMDSVEIFSK